VIDFSDNEIKRLDNFPRTKRLSSIVVNNNYVSRVGKLGENVPNLRYLVLTNNRLSSLTEIQNIATCQKLEHLSLLENSITQRPHYRLYVIHMIPTLKTLDYKKVEKKERDASKKFFKSAEGKQLLESIELERKAKAEGAVDTGATGAATAAALKPAIVLTEEQKKLVRAAIEAASTKEEIDAIERHLKVRWRVCACIRCRIAGSELVFL
jgi:U2 small nuclear ribonucleoprotein A'